MYKNFNLTDEERKQILEHHQTHGYKKPKQVNESFWDSIFGKPSVDDAARTQLKAQGHSFRGKEESGENYLVFNGEKFYPDQIVYADYQDLGELPRVENGNLIIKNPAWEL